MRTDNSTPTSRHRHADPTALAQLVADGKVIDCMNCLDPALWMNAGFTFRGIGRQQNTRPTE